MYCSTGSVSQQGKAQCRGLYALTKIIRKIGEKDRKPSYDFCQCEKPWLGRHILIYAWPQQRKACFYWYLKCVFLNIYFRDFIKNGKICTAIQAQFRSKEKHNVGNSMHWQKSWENFKKNTEMFPQFSKKREYFCQNWRIIRPFWQKDSHFEKIVENPLYFSSNFPMIFVSVGSTFVPISGNMK